LGEPVACGQYYSHSIEAMTLRQYVRRASKSNFASLAVDAAVLPQRRGRNERELAGTPQRNAPHGEHPPKELPLASMVLFDALALDAASCPRAWRQQRRRAVHQAAKLMMAQQASALKQGCEVAIPVSHVVSSFSPSNECTKGFVHGIGGSSDSKAPWCQPQARNQ